MDTKKKIIETSIALFNQFGYSSISMKQIADEMGLDRRNLTYHFNKEGLLKVISEQMWSELRACRAKKRDFPSFQNLDKEVVLYNDLHTAYSFIFKDQYVIDHPIIHPAFKEFSKTLIADSQQAVAFAIEQGNMKPETVPGAYNTLCTAVWTIAISWFQLNSLQGVKEAKEIRKLIWSLIIPHFTEKGIASFKAFFGDQYFAELGRPFDVKVKTLLF